MFKRLILPVLVVGVTFASGVGFIAAGGIGALAHDRVQCDTSTTDSPFTGIADPDAPYDLRFIDEMVMHHRGAIMSSEIMIADSEHPELRDLAQRIQESQQRLIDQMLDWRAEWYPDAVTPAMSMETGTGMMDGHGMMGGMMGGDMTDRMFLRMMIPHHQLAIEMAEDALSNAEHKEVKTLAQEIIDGQAAEITEMEGYLSDWYDDASTRDAAGAMHVLMRRMMGTC